MFSINNPIFREHIGPEKLLLLMENPLFGLLCLTMQTSSSARVDGGSPILAWSERTYFGMYMSGVRVTSILFDFNLKDLKLEKDYVCCF